MNNQSQELDVPHKQHRFHQFVRDSAHHIKQDTGARRVFLILQFQDDKFVHACVAESDQSFTLITHEDQNRCLPDPIITALMQSASPNIIEDVSQWENNICRSYFMKQGTIACQWISSTQGQIQSLLMMESDQERTPLAPPANWDTYKLLLNILAESAHQMYLIGQLNSELTLRRKSTQDLELREFRMRHSQHHAGIGNWDWDIATGELYWSESIAPLFGYKAGELATSYENFLNAIHPDDRKKVTDAVENCINGADYFIEHRVVWPDGTVRWVEEAGDVLRSSDGKAIRMLGVVRDIHERKSNEQERLSLNAQLQQAQKMEALGQLTAGIAHDFNNILAIINIVTGKINRKLQDKSTPAKAETIEALELDTEINHIEHASQRAKDLISKMLAFSRAKPAALTGVSLNKITEESIKMLRSMLPSSIEMIYKAEIQATILGDTSQIEQILMNLAINSRDAMDGKGQIKFTIKKYLLNHQTCASCHIGFSGSFIGLTVQDNGPGISLDGQHHLFEPFYTTKEVGKGSGLGLAMIDGMIHNHLGHILMESKPYQGLKMTLLFPEKSVATDDAQPSENSTTEPPLSSSAPRTGHILLVDDEPLLLKVMTEEFEDAGFKVTAHVSSEAALLEFNSNPEAFDLVILDQTMPKLTGLEMASLIHQSHANLPIFLFSGLVDTMLDQSIKAAGICRSFAKPIDIDIVINEVKNYLQPSKPR